jgi:hypothetical protein
MRFNGCFGVAVSAVLLFVVALSGCMCSPQNLKSLASSGEASSSNQEAQCEKPYILVGSECCLDEGDNGICDSDEEGQAEEQPQETPVEEEEPPTTLEAQPEETATSLVSTTATQAATSSTAQPTTTTVKVACSMNSDCGQRTEERICYQGDVYTQRLSPICNSPGTPAARCITKAVKDTNPTEKCTIHCVKGECVSE